VRLGCEDCKAGTVTGEWYRLVNDLHSHEKVHLGSNHSLLLLSPHGFVLHSRVWKLHESNLRIIGPQSSQSRVLVVAASIAAIHVLGVLEHVSASLGLILAVSGTAILAGLRASAAVGENDVCGEPVSRASTFARRRMLLSDNRAASFLDLL
jgi:hypothetical protein